MKSIKKTVSLLVLTLFIVSLAAGCGGGAKTETKTAEQAGQSAAQQAADKDKDYVIQLGYYKCDHMTAAAVAKETGIFDELGLKVNVTGAGKVPEAMAAGKMDVGYIGLEGLMRAYLKGSPILVAATNHLGGAYYLVGSNNIKTPKDLVGKKVALGKDPEKTSASWIQIANNLGLPVEGKNYQTFEMADKDKFFALKAGKLDGYISCDPWASMAEYEKAGKILATDTKLPNGDWGTCCVLSMNQNFVKEHPELAKKMIVAHSKAIQYIYTHPYKAAEIFAKTYAVPLEVALRTIHKKTVNEGRTLMWETDTKRIQNEIDYETSVKVLDKAPKVEEFVNTELAKQAGLDDFNTFIKEKVDPVFPVGMSFEDWKKKAAEIDGK